MDQLSWIYLIHIMSAMTESLLLPLFGRHLKELGASYFTIGISESLSATLHLISGPIVGSWSDKIGRKKVLLCCLLGSGLSRLLTGMTDSLYSIIIIKTIGGALNHALVLNGAILADVVSTSEHRLKYLGYSKAFGMLGFCIGPAISGNLAEYDNGFYYACNISFLLTLINMGVIMECLQETNTTAQKTKKESATTKSSIFDTLKSSISSLSKIEWWLYWDIMALEFLSSSMLISFLRNYFIRVQNRYQVPVKWIGYSTSIQFLSGMVAGFLSSNVKKLYHQQNHGTINFLGHVFNTLTYLGLAMTSSFYTFIILGMLNNANSMILRITTGEMMLKRCPPDKKGLIMGINDSALNSARLVTPVILATFEEMYGPNSGTVCAAALGLIATVVAVKVK